MVKPKSYIKRRKPFFNSKRKYLSYKRMEKRLNSSYLKSFKQYLRAMIDENRLHATFKFSSAVVFRLTPLTI